MDESKLTYHDRLLATRRTGYVNCTQCGRNLFEKTECRTGICASCRHKMQTPKTATQKTSGDLVK